MTNKLILCVVLFFTTSSVASLFAKGEEDFHKLEFFCEALERGPLGPTGYSGTFGGFAEITGEFVVTQRTAGSKTYERPIHAKIQYDLRDQNGNILRFSNDLVSVRGTHTRIENRLPEEDWNYVILAGRNLTQDRVQLDLHLKQKSLSGSIDFHISSPKGAVWSFSSARCTVQYD